MEFTSLGGFLWKCGTNKTVGEARSNSSRKAPWRRSFRRKPDHYRSRLSKLLVEFWISRSEYGPKGKNESYKACPTGHGKEIIKIFRPEKGFPDSIIPP